MSHPIRNTRRLFAFLLPLLLLAQMILAALAPAGAALAQSAEAAAAAAAPVRVALFYNADATTAGAYAALLNANGFTVQTFQVGATGTPTVNGPYRTLLPLIRKSGGGAQAAAANPNFSQFDVVIIGADTGAGATWEPQAGLFEAIRDSGLPVVGLGAGGNAFFGRLGLPIGYPNGVQGSAGAVQVADYGDSQDFYKNVAIPNDGVLAAFTTPQNVISIALADRLENGVRMAALAGNAGAFPIVQTDHRYLLWGFAGDPGVMTATGRQLFVNALSFNTQITELTLRSRTFIPTAGLDPALVSALQGTSGIHAFAQLTHIPSAAERSALEEIGIRLVNFVGNTLYVAFVTPTPDPNSATFVSLVRWLGPIQPVDKIDPPLAAGHYESWADNGDGTVKVLITFHQDVSDETAGSLLSGLGITPTPFMNHVFAVNLAKSAVTTVAQQDAVFWMEQGPPPLQPLNDVARTDLNVNAAQQANTSVSPAFYGGLDGSGVNVAIFDTGINTPTFTHNDFAGRLIRTANDTNGHGSHVAGIIGASGANSVSNCPYGSCTPYQMRGMAPAARLAPYNGGWSNAIWDDAINTNGVEVSNHSYVMTCGAYDSTAQTVDQLVRGQMTNGSHTIPPHVVVWAAANQGSGAQYCTTANLPGTTNGDPTTGPRGYFSVLSPAKNVITVGAFNRGDNQSVTNFSSRGPTWDGRLKPEVMGTGCMNSTDNKTQGYVGKCGTSMASPSVTGISALLTEQYHQSFPSAGRMTPSTAKAILVETATDMVHAPGYPGFAEFGWNDPDTGQPVIYWPGPDWSTGYGAVNAQKAASFIRAHNFLEGTVSPSHTTDNYTINVAAGASELKFTLAWDDEAGNPAWGVQARQLVNDLDLSLIAPDGTTVWRPWVLPALPRAALNGSGQDVGTPDPIVRATNIVTASRGVDNLNNLEQVQVPNPAAGAWTIRVNAASLPNGNAQKYSLAGDFRTFFIVEPKTGNPADAGDPANPNVIPVIVGATRSIDGSGSSLADATVSNFSVEIGGTAATIVSGSPVGDQFWLMVKPQPGIYTAGTKQNLKVTWAGHGEATEIKAVLFTEHDITDRAIVVDHSGSMSEYDKMAAAQNAARLFVDQSLPQDRIAVVSFSTSASTNYPITLVPSAGPSAVLDAAKTAINGLTPDAMTALGQGLLAGQAQISTAYPDPAVSYVKKYMVLLTDGMENVDPLYNTPAVKGVIEPTDTIIDTVGVGPASAGYHALLQQIATENGGKFRAVNQDGSSMAASVSAAAADAVAATGIDMWPTTLPNRLGDVYKQYAEGILDESRLFQAQGMGNTRQTFTIEVPENLQRVTFALNWSQSGYEFFLLTDPNKQSYFDPQNPQNGVCRRDTTLQSCIIEKPTPGTWTVQLGSDISGNPEWVLWVSAKTDVNFQLFVGTPEQDRVIGRPVQIIGFLSQGEKALRGQAVKVKVYGPNGDVSPELPLFDDGQHGDGAPDDGFYGNAYQVGAAGAYAVRGVAQGTDLLGKPFTLLKNTGFHARPKVVYIHKGDLATADAYKALIEANGVAVDEMAIDSVATANLSPYSLVIVGPDTGSLDQWGDDRTVSMIRKYEKPVLGLGEGGYAFFGKLGLAIGYANGAHSTGTTVLQSLFTDPEWHYPYDFPTGEKRLWQLYEKPSARVDILVNQTAGVQTFGYYAADSGVDTRYGDVVLQSNYFMLWGFQDGPANMTVDGQRLFVNSVYRTMH